MLLQNNTVFILTQYKQAFLAVVLLGMYFINVLVNLDVFVLTVQRKIHQVSFLASSLSDTINGTKIEIVSCGR